MSIYDYYLGCDQFYLLVTFLVVSGNFHLSTPHMGFLGIYSSDVGSGCGNGDGVGKGNGNGGVSLASTLRLLMSGMTTMATVLPPLMEAILT